jgi:dolichol-phosphate mannosyltransferase
MVYKVFFLVSYFFTGYDINPNSGDCFAFSRQCVNSITNIKYKARYLKYMIYEIGYRHCELQYTPINRSGSKKGKVSLQSFAFGIEIIVANSNRLIRICALMGLFASVLNILYIVYAVGYYAVFKFLLGKETVAGWTATNVVNSVMFFILFLILALISEYLTRILNETKKGDLYFIKEEHSSCVFPKDTNKKNVV